MSQLFLNHSASVLAAKRQSSMSQIQMSPLSQTNKPTFSAKETWTDPLITRLMQMSQCPRRLKQPSKYTLSAKATNTTRCLKCPRCHKQACMHSQQKQHGLTPLATRPAQMFQCPRCLKQVSRYSQQKKHGPTPNDQTNENVPMSPLSRMSQTRQAKKTSSSPRHMYITTGSRATSCRGRGGWERMRGPSRVPCCPTTSQALSLKTLPVSVLAGTSVPLSLQPPNVPAVPSKQTYILSAKETTKTSRRKCPNIPARFQHKTAAQT